MTTAAGDHFRVEGETGEVLGVPFTPTCWAFIDCEEEVAILVGPRREGKSVAGIAAIIRHRQRMRGAGALKAAIVRDTWTNLSRTVMETLREGHISGWWDVEFREGGTEAWINGVEGSHVWFFGMDRPADANKFQSFEAGLVSIEEPAPAADLASGVPVDVFGMAVSSLSQVNVPPRLQIVMNPSDEEHWPLWHGTPVLTPTGWVKIGDLRPGDLVIAADGTATEVTGVYPRGARPLYRVKFSDKASTLCTDDHPWGILTKWDRSGKAKRQRASVRMVTTGEIRRHVDARQLEVGLHPGRRHYYRWTIPLVAPVQFPEQTVPLDPYVLGALLGDGTLTMPNGQVNLCSADAEVVAAVRAGLPSDHYLRHLRKYDYVILSKGRYTPNLVNRAIRALGLSGHGAAAKSIPDCYLWNTPEVRLAVLQGLLDTDGHATRDGNSVSFASISERLVEGVEFLVRSLGGVARRRAQRPVGPRCPHELHVIGITLPEGVQPFQLSRKNARLKTKSKRHQARRYVVGVEPAGEGEAICISVAHPSHLFVVDQFIVAHNTLEVAAFLEEKNRADFRVATFWIPPGENPHLQAGYRERMRLGFEAANRQDLIMRLVEGKVATVSTGEAVTPEFSDLHLFKDANGKPEAAPMSPRWPTFRFFDFGHNPTCIWAQLTPMGWLNVLGAIVGENMGIEELIEQEVLPWQARFGMMPATSRVDSFGKVARSGYSFRDIGDAAARIREQTSTRRSAAWTLERMLRTSFEAAPIDWTSRRNAVKGVLNRNIGGRPMVMFDPFECKPLIKALRGGWRFAKGKDGKVSRLPIKDKSSHPGDAFAYGCAVLFPSYVSVTPAMPRETKLVLPPARSFMGR